MNLYDFDKTIYRHDSVMRFYRFFLLRHIWLFWHVFYMLPFAIRYVFRSITLTRLKEHFFLIFKFSRDIRRDVSHFWNREEKNIFPFYEENHRPSDVICSASPRFLLEEIVSRINPSATLVASEVDTSTMRYVTGEVNCKGYAKVDKLLSLGYSTFSCGFSDSRNDIPMLKLCREKFHVHPDGTYTPFPEKYFR